MALPVVANSLYSGLVLIYLMRRSGVDLRFAPGGGGGGGGGSSAPRIY